jgi:hypothetical protein
MELEETQQLRAGHDADGGQRGQRVLDVEAEYAAARSGDGDGDVYARGEERDGYGTVHGAAMR